MGIASTTQSTLEMGRGVTQKRNAGGRDKEGRDRL